MDASIKLALGEVTKLKWNEEARYIELASLSLLGQRFQLSRKLIDY